MHKKAGAILVIIFILSTLLVMLHNAALEGSWYWKFPWFDLVMHFLGGLVFGCISVWILLRFFSEKHAFTYLVWWLCGIVFVVGISWEVFEYLADVAFAEHYLLDTVSDMIMDLLGGLAALPLLLAFRSPTLKESDDSLHAGV